MFVLLVVVVFYMISDFIKSGKLQKLIDDNSDKSWSPKVQYQLGNIYQMASRYDNAENCYNRILEKHTSSQFTVDAMYNLGVIYEDTKRINLAREIYKKILSDYPICENKKMVETRLDFITNY